MFLDWLSNINQPTPDFVSQPAEMRGTRSSVTAKWWIFNSFQALKLILQPDSDDESELIQVIEVNHYESSNESGEDEDVPQIDGNPEHETDKDGELNDEPGASDAGEEDFFTFFKAPERHVNNAADKQKNVSKRGNPNFLSAPNVMLMCCFYILQQLFENVDFG